MDKLCRPAPSQLHIAITLKMSAPKQPGAEEAAAAPRHAFAPVQARGGERPLGPDVPQQDPVDAVQAERGQDGELNPTLLNLGQLRRERRRKRREEERRMRIEERKKEIESLMIDSDSSEEETCQEMTEPTEECYNNIIVEPVCEIIQISGRLHISRRPCSNHQHEQTEEKEEEGIEEDDQDDDPDVQDFKVEEDIKQETEPEDDDDASESDIDRNDAEQAELHDEDEEAIGRYEGEDLVKEETETYEDLEEEGDHEENEEYEEEEEDEEYEEEDEDEDHNEEEDEEDEE